MVMEFTDLSRSTFQSSNPIAYWCTILTHESRDPLASSPTPFVHSPVSMYSSTTWRRTIRECCCKLKVSCIWELRGEYAICSAAEFAFSRPVREYGWEGTLACSFCTRCVCAHLSHSPQSQAHPTACCSHAYLLFHSSLTFHPELYSCDHNYLHFNISL